MVGTFRDYVLGPNDTRISCPTNQTRNAMHLTVRLRIGKMMAFEFCAFIEPPHILVPKFRCQDVESQIVSTTTTTTGSGHLLNIYQAVPLDYISNQIIYTSKKL